MRQRSRSRLCAARCGVGRSSQWQIAAGASSVGRTRYERASIVLTTNRAPKEWGKVFNDATVASAVLDRLAHHSDLVVIQGRSFRTQRDAA